MFSLRWPASMQICWNKRKRLHKKRVQLPQDWFGTPTWPPWRHVKTLYMVLGDAVTKLQRFVWIFNHVLRVITWSLFNFRALNLFKKPISAWPFIWWCQFIDWFEFETRPNSLRNSEMANILEVFSQQRVFHWLLQSHMTSNNGDDSRQEPLSSRRSRRWKRAWDSTSDITLLCNLRDATVELSSHLKGKSILNRTDNNSVGQEMNTHTHICKLGKASKPLLHFCIYFSCLKWMKPRSVLGWT